MLEKDAGDALLAIWYQTSWNLTGLALMQVSESHN